MSKTSIDVEKQSPYVVAVSDTPSLMLDPHNGIVLCPKHHNDAHGGMFCGVK